jgi:uncharacterized repeat protein (TIGR03803 family)
MQPLRFAISSLSIVALIAGVVSLATRMVAAAEIRPAFAHVEFRILHIFKGRADGANPDASLINVNGTLYGTAIEGGPGGFGTIYSVDAATGAYNTDVRFNGSDGAAPDGALLDVNGTLYGTAASGGSPDDNGAGAIFSFVPPGTESVVYGFPECLCGDGGQPSGSLTYANGLLYGTTVYGGLGYGTIFSVDPTTGAEHYIYVFQGGADGQLPGGSLLNVNGTLYGTTSSGGLGSGQGAGTIFSVTPGGVKNTVYFFKGRTDGGTPNGVLTDVGGALYGTTRKGGLHGDGTVFGVTTSGVEQFLYSFKGGTDGVAPAAGVIDVNGTLYGTTSLGGAQTCMFGSVGGCGTIFSLTATGRKTVLHDFSWTQGGYPQAELLDVGGTLYGSAIYGGSKCYGGPPAGCGVLFSLRVPGS